MSCSPGRRLSHVLGSAFPKGVLPHRSAGEWCALASSTRNCTTCAKGGGGGRGRGRKRSAQARGRLKKEAGCCAAGARSDRSSTPAPHYSLLVCTLLQLPLRCGDMQRAARVVILQLPGITNGRSSAVSAARTCQTGGCAWLLLVRVGAGLDEPPHQRDVTLGTNDATSLRRCLLETAGRNGLAGCGGVEDVDECGGSVVSALPELGARGRCVGSGRAFDPGSGRGACLRR